jgi:1,4-dihydroxy-6-naphthoate synthase
MTTKIRLGISTCPNDTFAFHALLHRLVDWRGLDFEIALLDIQELNQRLASGLLDVAKASFHAALHLADRTVILPSGSALGFGVGPLLLAAKQDDNNEMSIIPTHRSQLTLCPGEQTTATLLFSLFYPGTTRVEQVVFSEIMPRLQRGQADFGVCIHEGRFTWQSQGLHLVEDLGERWERETAAPLPLGGLLAANYLPYRIIERVQSVVHDSLRFSLADPKCALPTMRHYAQEFDDAVLMKHVELYVNDWTVDLGPVGSAALHQLSQRARLAGVVTRESPDLSVFPSSYRP